MKLKTVISMLCRRKGVTLKDMARDTGLSYETILQWDEQEPRIGNVKRAADWLGIGLDALVGMAELEDDLQETHRRERDRFLRAAVGRS